MKIAAYTTTCVLIFMSSVAHAQESSTTDNVSDFATYISPFTNNRIELLIDPASPVECDAATIAAANHWNGEMENFRFLFTGPRITSASTTPDTLRVKYVPQNQLSKPQTLAQASNAAVGGLGSREIFGTQYNTTNLGLVMANLTRWQNGTWDCDHDATTPITKFDAETIFVHEFGHNIGLGHQNKRECVMYPTMTTGEDSEALCSTEQFFANKAYEGL